MSAIQPFQAELAVALMRAKLPTNTLEELAHLPAAALAILTDQDASVASITAAWQRLTPDGFDLLADINRGMQNGLWDSSKPLPLLEAMYQPGAIFYDPDEIACKLGLDTFPLADKWADFALRSSGDTRTLLRRTQPLNLVGTCRELVHDYAASRPWILLHLLYTTPAEVVPDEEVLQLLNSSSATGPLVDRDDWEVHAGEPLLWILDSRPGLCALLAEDPMWLPLISRTSHWKPEYLNRLPVRTMPEGSGRPSPAQLVALALGNPVMTTEQTPAVSQEYLDQLRSEGVITEEEFDELTDRLRSSGPNPVAGSLVRYPVTHLLQLDGVYVHRFLQQGTSLDEIADKVELPIEGIGAYRYAVPGLDPNHHVFASSDQNIIRTYECKNYLYPEGWEPAVVQVAEWLEADHWESKGHLARAVTLLAGFLQTDPIWLVVPAVGTVHDDDLLSRHLQTAHMLASE